MLDSKYSSDELLKFAFENGMLDISSIKAEIDMKNRREYLSMHKYDVWQGKNGLWYTYLPDEEKGRVLKKRVSKEAIEQEIVDYYMEEDLNPTVKEVFLEWIKEKREYNEISKQSYDRYMSDFTRFFYVKGYCIANYKIKCIDEEYLEGFIKTVISKLELTQKAYAGLRIIINGVFKYAKKKKYTKLSITNFMGDLDLSRYIFRKKVIHKENEILLEDEIPLFVNYLKENEDIKNLGVLIALQTGLRVGELSALKKEDLKQKVLKKNNAVEYFLQVNRTEIKHKDDNGNTIFEVRELPKSVAGVRNVILNQSAVDTIRKVIHLNPFGEYLFMENGKRMRGNYFNRRLTRVCDNLNISHKSMHKLRKTYGTTLIDSNTDDAIVAEMMGHEDINTTKKYYYLSNKNEYSKMQQVTKALSKLG